MSGSVLVTGAAGFLGANLVPELIARGYDVIGLDDLSTGRFGRIAPYIGGRFSFVQADVRDPAAVRRAAEGAGHIIHLAELRSAGRAGILTMLDVNVRGTETVVEVAVKHGSQVVLGSTEEVYGKSAGPLNEESALVIGQSTDPRWAFPASKLLAEQLCFAYRERYEVPITILRYATAYGPHHPLDGKESLPALVASALRREPIPIGAGGLEKRTFTSVRDLVMGTLLVLETSRAEGEIINIGGGEQLRLVDLARLVWTLAGHSEKAMVLAPSGNPTLDVADVRYRLLDLSKARALLGYEPGVSIAEGLRQTIDWQHRAMDPAVS